jgi:hypothetical protein
LTSLIGALSDCVPTESESAFAGNIDPPIVKFKFLDLATPSYTEASAETLVHGPKILFWHFEKKIIDAMIGPTFKLSASVF